MHLAPQARFLRSIPHTNGMIAPHVSPNSAGLSSLAPPFEFAVCKAEGSVPPLQKQKHPVLYAHTLCPYAERTFLALLEKQAGYFTLCHIDLSNKPSWYTRQINPGGLVPALSIGDQVRVESLDLCTFIDRHMCAYLEEHNLDAKCKGKAGAINSQFTDTGGEGGKDGVELSPPTEQGRRKMENIIPAVSRFAESGLGLLAGRTARYWGIGSGHSEAQRAGFKQAVSVAIDEPLEQHGGPYLMGDSVSLADIAVFPFAKRFAVALPEFCGFEFQDVSNAASSWLEVMSSRDACRVTAANDEMLLKAYKKHRCLDFFDYDSFEVWALHPHNREQYPSIAPKHIL